MSLVHCVAMVYALLAGGQPLRLPLAIIASLTANPKHLEWYPKSAELNSELRCVVTKSGRFRVTHFSQDRSWSSAADP